ncbi:MAG: cysteine hydrolase [Alphaproteobacteria bacterium]|nr:cysteine hydrolase [Alphaproteobacteria bacterium]
MADPKTLLELAGANLAPGAISDSVLLLIDCQREYIDGQLPLHGVNDALRDIGQLTERYREAGSPIVHVLHRGAQGGLFDRDAQGGQVAPEATPTVGESIIDKTMPNAFADTKLEETLKGIGRKNLVVVGFMTHMCVSTTVRAGLDLGYACTVIANATATRDLAVPGGGVVDAATVQKSSLAAIADRFAVIVASGSDLPD